VPEQWPLGICLNFNELGTHISVDELAFLAVFMGDRCEQTHPPRARFDVA